MRARFKAMGLPCAICGRAIHYDEPSDAKHPLSFVIDEIKPVGRYREWGYENKTAAALDPDNVQPVHWICNARKGARTMEEIRCGKTIAQTNEAGGRAYGTPNGRTIVCLPDGKW